MSRGIWKFEVRWVAGAVLLALAGCVSEPRYAEAPGSGYDPRYQGYWSAEERVDDEPEAESEYVPDYLAWPEYYSVLWPVYQYAYDPWYHPGFYYGVTYFPSTWFGLGYYDPYACPYYVPYSPYLYSPWDNYYVWYGGGHHHGHHHRHHRHGHDRDHDGHHGRDHDDDDAAHDGRRRHRDRDHPPGQGSEPRPRFGSDVNQAQRMADLNQAERMRRGPESRLRQNRPGADGFRDPTAQEEPAPTPKPGASERRSKPGAASDEGWTAGQGTAPRPGATTRDRPPGASEPRAYVARPPARYRYDDAAPRRGVEAREGGRVGSAPGPGASAPEAFAPDPDGSVAPRGEQPRVRMPAFDTNAPPRGERSGREQPRLHAPIPEASERRTVERQRAPVVAPYARPAPASAPTPYAGAGAPVAPVYAAPRGAPESYNAPRPPPMAAPPARAPAPAPADRPVREDVRGGDSTERNR
jgi:hypothetical protein